ncbi:uncharacterized protein [Macrobrachium rosenbergii]|uniref:uncharacterized protein n=1 Tax=Macrobrachium rosenbergii TaxID=79674 RepID=UPI0034D7A51D
MQCGRGVKILRDTGASQSLILRSSVPDDVVFRNKNFVLLGGFPDTVATYPLEEMYLKTKYFQGMVNLAIVDALPIPDVDVIFVNDLAAETECDVLPILTLADLAGDQMSTDDLVNPVSVVTRSQSKEVDLEEVELDAELINRQTTDIVTGVNINNDDNNVSFQGINWYAKAFKEAQGSEFNNLELNDGSDLSKPVFMKQDGLFYRVSRPVNVPADQVEVIRQLVVPERYRRKLLFLSHEHNVAGHFGVKKTFQKLAQHFFWPQMRRKVKRHVLSCKVCQVVGKPNQKIPKSPLIPIPSVGEPFKEVVIDVVGPLPRTRGGNEYLLTMVDRVTRFPEAIPLRSIRGEKVVEALFGFFTRFGIPKVLQSDCGTNFTSKFFKKKMVELGVSHVTSSYHPESQDQVETFHQTLKSVFKKFCIETGNEWDKEVPYALFAIRSVPNESLGFSPFELVFAHCVHGPLDVVREHWEGETPEANVLDYVSSLQGKLRRDWNFAQANLRKSQTVMKSNYDIGTKIRIFKPGDCVLVLLPIPGNPLKAQFSGPWSVLKKLTDVNYLIETPGRRRKSRICHVNMLKPFVSRDVDQVESVVVDPITVVSVEVDENPLVNKKMSVNPDVSSSNSDILNNLSTKFQHLNSEKSEALIGIIHKYKDLFQDELGRTNVLDHDVDVGDTKPVKQCPYRLNPVKRKIVQEEVRYMLDHDLIKPSCSPWSSPVVLVKKEGGQHRLCFDYRKVNELTKTDSFPLPRVEDCIDRIGSAKFITKLDLLKGYWQYTFTFMYSDRQPCVPFAAGLILTQGPPTPLPGAS